MSEDLSWIKRARLLVSYHQEALDFIRRAGEQLPAIPSHAPVLSRLWAEADQLDEMICSLLNEMNTHLIEGAAELDTTRGASMRPTILEDESLFYDCSWNLLWEDGHGISVNLAIDPGTGVYEVQVRSLGAMEVQGLRFPFSESDLKEALVRAYVAEVTQGLE